MPGAAVEEHASGSPSHPPNQRACARTPSLELTFQDVLHGDLLLLGRNLPNFARLLKMILTVMKMA